MRTSTVLLLICIASSVFAAPNTSAKVIELLQSGSKAADAVDSALQVLYDLEAANADAQDAADELNRTQQAAGEAEIEDLRQIAEANKESGNSATEHRKYLEGEIADTEAYLEWIANRRTEIHAREEELQDQRCYSNAIFVRALKNLADGLEAIELLRNDVLPAADRADGAVELVSIKDATKKLSAYKNLFNEQAIAEFEQLAGHIEDAQDNAQAGLELLRAGDAATGRGVGGGDLNEQIHNLLTKFENQLEAEIENLKENEIKAAWALAVWLQDSEEELNNLANEEERRETYLEKLNISVQAARASEAKAWEIFHQSAQAYADSIAELQRKGDAYLADKHQREDENALIAEVIKLFREQVANLARNPSTARNQNVSDRGQIEANVNAAINF
jgi:hypothetical protein